jgi:hypothetical protein
MLRWCELHIFSPLGHISQPSHIFSYFHIFYPIYVKILRKYVVNFDLCIQRILLLQPFSCLAPPAYAVGACGSCFLVSLCARRGRVQ